MPEARRDEDRPSMTRTLIQAVGMFFLTNYAIKQFIAPKTATSSVSGGGGAVPSFTERPVQMNPDGQYNVIPQRIAPMWAEGTEMDLRVYVSPSVIMPALKSMPPKSLVLDEHDFRLGNWSEKRDIDATFTVPKEVQNNGTLFAHFYIAQKGSAIDPTSPHYDPAKAYNFVWPLTQFLPKKKVVKTHNLLSGNNEKKDEAEEAPKGPIITTYYHSNFTFSVIPDTGTVMFPTLHPAVRQFVQLERSGARDGSGQNTWYYPTIYVNTFWQLRDHMVEVNSTVKELPIHIHLNHLSNWKFSLLSSVDEGMKQTQRNAAHGNAPATGDGSELEMFKKILLDSNIYLLATTGVVSVLHMIFEMLAFKNDVSHWRKKKDNVGTSVRTILANVFMQLVIFLYLLDNNENTSWMILFGQGMGIAIEAWKITKTVNVRVRPTPPGSLLPYSIVFEDKHQLSETEKKTEEYDQIAFKYLYMVAVPLLLAYAVYSLIYDSHKSWYSFIITTLVGSVYAYGFLMMVPSLYINYRLKSVAHMPAKAMMYKFLNTFIDDLFAFTIKMPLLHRLATLRDDVIFFVYLYQAWKYKIDYTRVNEFGQGGDDEDEKAAKPAKDLTPGTKPTAGPNQTDNTVAEAVKATGQQEPEQARKRK